MDRVLTLAPGAETGSASAGAAPAEVRIGALYGELKQPTTKLPTQAELDAADVASTNWLMYNKGYTGQRYSRLTQINTANARNLRPVCMFQLGEIGTFSTGPVMYDGLLYVTTHLGTYAIDATTCKKVWTHQHVAQGPEMNATNKGIAIAGGRVIRGAQDGVLFALDAKTGTPLWVRQVADWSIGEGIGAAPIVLDDVVYVGKAGGDWGIKGRMMAFKVDDGSLLWSFDLIPTGTETGADTWQPPASAEHGGGAAWVTYALDRKTNTLFIPVGNPGPDLSPRDAQGRQPVHDLHGRARCQDRQAQVVVSAASERRPRLGRHGRFAVRRRLRKYVATAGKEGILHVVNRDDGKLVFKLPMTTLLNHDVPITKEGVRVCPWAGVQWNGAAWSPSTELLYVNAIDWCTVFKLGPEPKWVATVPFTGLANGFGNNDPIEKWAGWINAVDPRTGKMAWRVKWPTPMYASITPTAGNLLFTGDLNGNFLALDARNGSTLYSFPTGGPIAGGVITYETGGKQYVAVASGHSGGSIPLTGSTTVVIFGQ